MKKIVTSVILMALLSPGASAQRKSSLSITDIKKRVKEHQPAPRAEAKTTAVYWRLSAYAIYNQGGAAISDSGRYVYSNARGSSFDYEYMEYDDYGVDPEYNKTSADTCYKYTDNGSGLELDEKYTSTYNASDLRTIFIDQTGPQLPNLYKELGTYDANGNLVEERYQEWDAGGNKWEDDNTSFYTYDANNNLISDSTYDYFFMNPDLKGIYTYDANNNMTSLTYYQWTGSAWEGAYAAQIQYDGNNRPVLSIYQNYYNGNWVDYSKDSITYTGGNDIYTSSTYMEWDTTAKQWNNSYRETRTFTSNNVPATAVTSYWDGNSSQWENSQETEYSYNSNNDIEEAREYLYINGTKQPNYSRKIKYYYEHYFNVSVPGSEDLNEVISIYPNPATSNINIMLGGQKDVQVSLVNMTGQTVRSVAVADGTLKATINIEGLAAGNYILNVSSGTQSIGKKMVTIN